MTAMEERCRLATTQTASLSTQPELQALRAAFDRLLVEHQDRALRLALRLLSGDRAGAEDVVQEAFVRAYKGLERFRGDASLTTWFDQILVRECYRHLRSPWRRWFAGEPLDADEVPARVAVSDPGLQRQIEGALASLSAHQRTVFVLVHLEGYSITEAARLMRRSPGTLKSHLHRALSTLRKQLGEAAVAHELIATPTVGDSSHD